MSGVGGKVVDITTSLVSAYQNSTLPVVPTFRKAIALGKPVLLEGKRVQQLLQRSSKWAVLLLILRRLQLQLPNIVSVIANLIQFVKRCNSLMSNIERKRRLFGAFLAYLCWPTKKLQYKALKSIVEETVYEVYPGNFDYDHKNLMDDDNVNIDLFLVGGFGDDFASNWMNVKVSKDTVSVATTETEIWKHIFARIAGLSNKIQAEEKKNSQCRILLLKYDLSTALSSDSDDALNDIIERLLLSIHYSQTSAYGRRRKMLFVCHGFGGNIIKAMLKHAALNPHKPYGDIHWSTLGVLFLETIHSLPPATPESILNKVNGYTLNTRRNKKLRSSIPLLWINKMNETFFSEDPDSLHWQSKILYYSIIPKPAMPQPQEFNTEALLVVPENNQPTSTLYPQHAASIPSNMNIKFYLPPTETNICIFTNTTSFIYQTTLDFIEKAIKRSSHGQSSVNPSRMQVSVPTSSVSSAGNIDGLNHYYSAILSSLPNSTAVYK